MERINVDVSDLCLWETNPRVEPSIDQMDELNKIYNFSAQSQSTSKRQLMNLASSIAENGYQNDVEPILATRAGDKYVIHDANRRLSAIKLLQNPDCYRELLDDRDYKRLKNLVAEYPQNIPSSLDMMQLLSTTLMTAYIRFGILSSTNPNIYYVKSTASPSTIRMKSPRLNLRSTWNTGRLSGKDTISTIIRIFDGKDSTSSCLIA